MNCTLISLGDNIIFIFFLSHEIKLFLINTDVIDCSPIDDLEHDSY